MNIISLILFSLTANIDNFIVGASYGMKNIKIGLVGNIIIALFSLFGTALSMLAGRLALGGLPEGVSRLAGGMLLILLGLYSLIRGIVCRDESPDPELADKNCSGKIEPCESVAIALALTLNNLALGAGASASGISITAASLLTFALSLSGVSLGFFMGQKHLAGRIGGYSEAVSGGIIILMGAVALLL